MFANIILERYIGLLEFAHKYLLSYVYVNFGVALAIKDNIPTRTSNGRVIVSGAGLCGLAAARQLMIFGFEVIVLEGRKRAG
uniref:Amine oxidase domain-containing protein n=1 Tax=Solanum lycopersicum TaxID=4081 RepID=A0A3Q7GFI5_SOLLC